MGTKEQFTAGRYPALQFDRSRTNKNSSENFCNIFDFLEINTPTPS